MDSIIRTLALLVAWLVAALFIQVNATASGAAVRRNPAAPRGLQSDAAKAGLEREANDLKVYRALVIDYRAGHAEAVAALLAWDHKRLSAALALIDTLYDAASPWAVAHLRSASMMHTDAAIRLLGDGPVHVGSGSSADETVFFHLSIASSHLRRGGTALAPFASRWVLAVSRLMRSRGEILDAERLLKMGREIVVADSIVLYESGLVQEMFSTWWQTAPRPDRLTLRDIFGDRDIDSVLSNRARRLGNAESWLRQSVEAGPSNIMARLHLGRVLMMHRSNDEALRVLRGVLDSTTDRATAYLAAVFIGALHERDGRLDEAAAAYRLAIDRFARGHAAYVALSEVLQRAGRGDESRAVLRQVLTDAPDARREPWSWYFIEPPEVARERIDALREEGRR